MVYCFKIIRDLQFIIYSIFRINKDYSFDDDMTLKFNCTVRSFDPR